MNTNFLTLPNRQNLNFDIEQVSKDIKRLSYADINKLRDSLTGEMSRSMRSQIRYLAALFPNLSLKDCADRIAYIIDNRNLYPKEVRLILEGRSLYNPQKHTTEIPFESIQTIGRVLLNGGKFITAVKASGVCKDTVKAIDDFLGVTRAWDDRALDTAIDGLREGWSVRQLAAVLQIPKTTAHRLMIKAREVLEELGEM